MGGNEIRLKHHLSKINVQPYWANGCIVYQNLLPRARGYIKLFDNVANPGMESLIPPSLPAAARAICRARLPFAKGLPLRVSRRHGSEPHLEAEFTPLAALMRLREKLS